MYCDRTVSGSLAQMPRVLAEDVRPFFVMRVFETRNASLMAADRRFMKVEREIRLAIRAKGGGEEGIRTLDTTFAVWRFSKALPSATRPPLRCRSYDSNRPEGSNRKACTN